MATIVTRSGKGSALTFTEGDANFTNLNNDKLETSGGTITGYKETVYTGGATTGTITPDVANGNVQSITLTGNITFNSFANASAGQSLTLIVNQPTGSTYTLTSTTIKWAGGDATLSEVAAATDIISVFYDGTNYYASLAKGFAEPETGGA